MREPILQVEDLSGGYGSRTVVRQVSFSVQKGEWLSIVGPNGSGKSTVLRMLSRVLIPQAGRVYLGGRICTLNSLPSRWPGSWLFCPSSRGSRQG